jgi:hypothetical protein
LKPRVLLNRVDRQVIASVTAFQAAGFDAYGLPCEFIKPLALDPPATQWIADLDQFTHVILTSPTAADCFDEVVTDRWVQWPMGVRLWAVGPGTAAAYRGDGPTPQCPDQGVGAQALISTLVTVCLPSERILVATGVDGGHAFEVLPNVQRMVLFTRTPTCPEWPHPMTWGADDVLVHGSEQLLIQCVRCFAQLIPRFWQMRHVVTNARAVSHLPTGTRYYLIEAPTPEAVRRALAEEADNV